jgi:hypothetical protein
VYTKYGQYFARWSCDPVLIFNRPVAMHDMLESPAGSAHC